MKKVIAILSAVVLVLALNTGICFADVEGTATTATGTNGPNMVHAYLSMEPTQIDFNISENIYLQGVTNSVDLTCTDLLVVNNLQAGSIQVTSVTAAGNAEANWSIVAFTTNFAALPLNSNQLGLKCEGVDMFNNVAYGPTAAIEPQKTLAIKFTAKTGATSSQITNVKVADVVATVAMVDTSSELPTEQSN